MQQQVIPWRKIRLLCRWILPVFVLYFVLRRIDLQEFMEKFLRTDPQFFFPALCLAPFLILIGAWRWHSLLRLSSRKIISAGFIIKHYWTGLALGFFVPSSLGWDAYRVFVSGKKSGDYSFNIGIIITEKILALITCMSIIVVVYPMMASAISPDVEKIFHLAALLLGAAVTAVAALFFIFRSRFFSLVLARLEKYSDRLFQKICTRMGLQKTGQLRIPVREMFAPLASPKIFWIIVLSFSIQFVSAVKSQMFFHSLGYDLPFIVNMFVVPALYFIFLLPVSFGSVGIREGVYVVLYGLFGVPAEIALLVSFFNLAGILLNYAIGGMVMFFSFEKQNRALAYEQDEQVPVTRE